MKEKYEGENLRNFLEELDNIKLSDPKKIVLPKTKQEPKVFFTKFFENEKLNVKEKQDIVYENINVEGYTSIIKIIQSLQNLINYIYIETGSIVEKYKKRIKSKKELFPYVKLGTYNYFSIGYYDNNSNKYYKEKDYYHIIECLKIDISQFPKFDGGNYECYEYLKEDFFKLFPYIKLYISILLKIKSKGNIIARKVNSYRDSYSNISNLKIFIDNQNDVFRKEIIVFKIEILDAAMIEYVVGEKISCLSYADDFEILNHLKNEEMKLLYSCYLSNDLDIVKLLNKASFEEK